MNKDYFVEIAETSRQLTAKQRIALKNGFDAMSIDQMTQVEPLTIDPEYWAMLNVHNEKSDDKEYSTLVIVDKNGEAYVTGSRSFVEAFQTIWDEMTDANAVAEENGEEVEDFKIKCFRKESKNYKGKSFITCTIV